MGSRSAGWQAGTVRAVPVAELGGRYQRYRLADGVAEEAMLQSLVRYGQLTPVVACARAGGVELLDGFKRRAAALRVPGLETLSTRVLELDERLAKAAIFACNSTSRPTHELEEAWIVQALVREDGMTQVEVGELLGRHKSWVCRRLALLEKLSSEVREELGLGLLSLRLARQLTALPAGNQQRILDCRRRATLTTTETHGLITLFQRAKSPEQEQFLLSQPREALQQAQGIVGPVHDPRLSAQGNHLARRLATLLTALDNMQHWHSYPGLYELKQRDRELLVPRLAQLAEQARTLADLVDETLASAPKPFDNEPAHGSRQNTSFSE
jgi:ParB-like chromosome segregation protein Spo0J